MDERTCSECAKYDASQGVCGMDGQVLSPDEPACKDFSGK